MPTPSPRLLLSSPSLSVLLAVVLSACGPENGVQMDMKMDPSAALDYHRDAKAVLNHYCVDCHTAGGIAPFALADHGAAKAHAGAMERAVSTGTMPPWQPGDDSLPLRHSRKMRPEDKALLLAWIKEGAKEGDPKAQSRVQIPAKEALKAARPDLVLDGGVDYPPSRSRSDDYRCFAIDPGPMGTGGLGEDRFLRAAEIVPGSQAIVHHVAVFSVDAGHAADVRKKDADEAGPGYTCFGGAGVGGAELVVGWAVGGGPMRLDEDQGMLLRKGSIFVLQVHYNLVNHKGETDRTRVRLELFSQAPAKLVMLLPIVYPAGLQLKAGDAAARQLIPAPVTEILKRLGRPGQELSILSVMPHMHLLGKRIVTSLNEQTMLSIPSWNFNWQQSYVFEKPVIAREGQYLNIDCRYDNSAQNQPVVDGVRQPPKDVRFGEGTGDEMCVSLLGVQFPRP